MAKDLIGGIFDNVVNRKGKKEQDNYGSVCVFFICCFVLSIDLII